MKRNSVFDLIHIDEFSATPKYLQLTNSILTAISAGKMKKDDVLPSINELSFEFEISRDTAEKGYRHLKNLGVLNSVPGKGYYIANTDVQQNLRIVLFFNKLSAHKKIIYDSFVETIGQDAAIDFYIYNNDLGLFKKLLNNAAGQYTHYVIIPHFIEGGDNAAEIINAIPKEKLILLDKKIDGITGKYGAVYENFEKDIYHALEEAKEQLSKYHTLKLVFPNKSYFPVEIAEGFRKFCLEYAFTCQVVNDVETDEIKEGNAYINLMESDLVTLIERIVSLDFEVGKQVGVISYNETPLKKIILNGITTISTDFNLMGKMAAQLILTNSKDHLEVPFHITLRSSL